MTEKSQNGWPTHKTSKEMVPLHWITGRVHPAVHEYLNAFCQRFNDEIEKIEQWQSWGYAYRKIDYSTDFSNHASGTAIDLNAVKHPMGAIGTFTAKQHTKLQTLLKDFPELRWGGNYSGRKDEMHFEINVTPDKWKGGVGVSKYSKMASPLGAGHYKTAGFKTPSYPGHWGLDLGVGGQYGKPVYAMFPGVMKSVVKWAKKGNTKSTWAPGRTGNGGLCANKDGEGQGYNHVRLIVNEGDEVKLGQLIGYLDDSGRQTGAHLHLEWWRDWKDHRSVLDPEILWRVRGLKIGSVFNIGGGTKPAEPKPTPPKTKPKGYTEDDFRIQAALIRMGYYSGKHDGVNGPMQKASVASYQRSQLWPAGGLVADGHWGGVTQKHYEWTRKLQTAMNKWKGTKLIVDGDCRALTMNRVLDLQVRNHNGTYRGFPDGTPGPIFCKMLGIPTHP